MLMLVRKYLQKDLLLMKSNRKYLIIASIMVLILMGCALNVKSKWQILKIKKYGIVVEMPGNVRHFSMSSQTSGSSLSFEEWLVNDDETESQYFVILQELKSEKYKGKADSWVLENAPRANIGFMMNAKELSKKREYQGNMIYDEQVWQIDKRQEAVTRTYAKSEIMVQLIHLYPKKAPAELERIRFMDSIKFGSDEE